MVIKKYKKFVIRRVASKNYVTEEVRIFFKMKDLECAAKSGKLGANLEAKLSELFKKQFKDFDTKLNEGV
jgi:hypothetical protein